MKTTRIASLSTISCFAVYVQLNNIMMELNSLRAFFLFLNVILSVERWSDSPVTYFNTENRFLENV